MVANIASFSSGGYFMRLIYRLFQQSLAACLLITALSMSGAAMASPQQECAALFERGNQAYRQGDYPKAISYLERAAQMAEGAFGATNLNVSLVYNSLSTAYLAQENLVAGVVGAAAISALLLLSGTSSARAVRMSTGTACPSARTRRQTSRPSSSSRPMSSRMRSMPSESARPSVVGPSSVIST